MNPKLKWTLIAGGAAAAVAVTAVILVNQPGAPGKVEQTDTPAAIATLPPIDPTATAIPGDDAHNDAGAAAPDPNWDEDGSTDGHKTGETVDWNTVKDVAGHAVMEYSRVIEGESADARAARLAPYIEAGSPLLTQEPTIGNPWGYANVQQNNIIWRGDPVSGVNDKVDGQYVVMTVAPYNAIYTVNEQPQDVVNTGKWDVRVSETTGKVTAITEPAILY
ncbi:hypothetical protein [Agromyces humi]|uniref:hypothetical protein n=1 Tax=Agromyces humi TaxID=1766800 RepID=UPI00135AA881|nr:hypothetical protein [Agromyces humi]